MGTDRCGARVERLELSLSAQSVGAAERLLKRADGAGNLFTIVLFALIDFMLGAGVPTVPTLIGGALIIGAFASLALDSLRS